MIEVEKKFVLTESQIPILVDGAEFLGEKVFTDTYYDTVDYTFAFKDMWMRLRDGKPELKIPSTKGQYEEVEDEGKIRKQLSLTSKGSLVSDMETAGIRPVSNLTTTRRKYKKDNLIIDLDNVDFGDFSMQVGELEVMIESEEQIDGALKIINDFANQYELDLTSVRTKAGAWYKHNEPDIYHALVAKGILKNME